jgi:hypothetical protein
VRHSQVAFGHKSIKFNEQWSTASPPVAVPSKFNDTITIDRGLVRPQYRDTRDALHLGQGGTAGRVHKGMLLLSVSGRILTPNATQAASLTDKEMALRLALDPYECYRDSPTTDGVYALDWQEPTADTTNYPTGWIALRRYARPIAQPETVWAITDGGVIQWSCGFACPDPRLYEQTAQTSTGSPGTRSLVNLGNVPAPLRVTITMGGAGDSNFTITRSSVAFILDLSGLTTGNIVVVTMETSGPFARGKRITVAGTDAFNRKTSAATTWLDVPVGTTSFTVANTTNITSLVYDWLHTRA